jgi:hypothetical protein
MPTFDSPYISEVCDVGQSSPMFLYERRMSSTVTQQLLVNTKALTPSRFETSRMILVPSTFSFHTALCILRPNRSARTGTIPAVCITVVGRARWIAFSTSTADVTSTLTNSACGGILWTEPGGAMSMTVMAHLGYFSAIALAIADPTKPQPPVMRILLSSIDTRSFFSDIT